MKKKKKPKLIKGLENDAKKTNNGINHCKPKKLLGRLMNNALNIKVKDVKIDQPNYIL